MAGSDHFVLALVTMVGLVVFAAFSMMHPYSVNPLFKFVPSLQHEELYKLSIHGDNLSVSLLVCALSVIWAPFDRKELMVKVATHLIVLSFLAFLVASYMRFNLVECYIITLTREFLEEHRSGMEELQRWMEELQLGMPSLKKKGL